MYIDLEKSKKYFELGINSFENSNYIDAENFFRLSLYYAPTRISVLNNLSAVLIKLNKYDEAYSILNNVISKLPNDPISHLNYGNLYLKIHDLDSAAREFMAAINFDSNYPEALNNYAFVQFRLGNYDKALAYFKKAISLKSDYVEPYYNISQCYIRQQRFSEAILILEKALRINHEYDDLYLTYVFLHQKICKWDYFSDLLKTLKNLLDQNIKIYSIFHILSLYDDPKLHLAQAIKYSNNEFPRDLTLGKIKKYNNNKIKVGYFSADFHNHATSYLITELFELHDKSQFEIHIFSFGPSYSDDMRNRINRASDFFHDVAHLSDIEIAKLSRSNCIDIAVDLKGYTFNCRPGIFSKRAAPVQVNYLGYPGTMGAEYIDYIIADSTVIDQNNYKTFSEQIVYLPNCYQANDSKRKKSSLTTTREQENLPKDKFIFCCFNNVYKILPEIFSLWMDILKNVDNSILWLLDDNPIATSNLRNQAILHDIDSNRLIFAVHKSQDFHLSRLSCADLFLDTLPYNAHTTASDSLLAGVPVLTCKGSSFASRVSSSLLLAINLPELITENLSEYRNKAIEIALNPLYLADIKRKLNTNKFTTPLFNSKLFTKNIEKIYFKMMETSELSNKIESKKIL